MAAPSILQSAQGRTAGTSGTSCTASLGALTAGTQLFAIVSGWALSNTFSISSTGATWVKATTPGGVDILQDGDANHNDFGLFCTTTRGTGTTITFSWTGSNPGSIIVFEVQGSDPTVKQMNVYSNGGNDTATPYPTGSVTTTVADCLMVSWMGFDDNAPTSTITNPSGYSTIQANTTNASVKLQASSKALTGTGTENPSWATSNSEFVIAFVVGIPPSSGGTTQNITVSATGKSAPTFGLQRTRGVILSVTGHSAPVFATGRIRALPIATTGHSSPAFTTGRTRVVSFSATGRAAPSFQFSGFKPVGFSVTGRSAPTFGMRLPVSLHVVGRSAPAFGLSIVGGVSQFARWAWRFHAPNELVQYVKATRSGMKFWKG